MGAMTLTAAPSPAAAVAPADQIHVILPTYNEVENLEQLVPQLLALPNALRVLVVDDNSPDGTGALADRLAAAQPERVGVIHRAGKLGSPA